MSRRAVVGTVVALFIGAQFIRPARTNPAVDRLQTLDAQAEVPAAVGAILRRSCMNCHSYETEWPWYSNVAPVSWFVINHVTEAREHMNFSRWGEFDLAERVTHLKEICRMVRERAMPLPSYTWMHREAPLSDADVELLCRWTAGE